MLEHITVKGARVHNLKNISLNIPRGKFIVITGPSGSGKSSLAFDTIYAEGQRRYVESLSAYARQFLEQLQKPDVDSIEGLSPSIAIEQKTTTKNPRSTVGTITEIYDYLRVVYTRIGDITCYKCGSPITSQGIQQMIESLTAMPEGTRIQILSPVVAGRKGEYRKELHEIRQKGFIRARIDGEMTDITREIKLNKHKRHNIDIVIDRLIIKAGIERRLTEALELALKFTATVIINLAENKKDLLFSRKSACPVCGISYPEISPRFFSFNSPYGACPKCNGIGFEGLTDDVEDTFDSTIKQCTSCGGSRLRKEASGIKLGGLTISELSHKSIKDAVRFFDRLELKEKKYLIVSKVLKEIKERLIFLDRVGLSYLTLDRPAFTLSGGEGQRIRLATQIGSSLTGVLYILDEPSIGLHQRDCGKLLESLCALRDMGNTVIVVEHDEETIRRANHIIDMGPGAGVNGGSVVAEGSLHEIMEHKESLTGAYLSGSITIPTPVKRRKPGGFLTILRAKEFNLKNIDVKIPLGNLVCLTGVSGSGKSTLMFEILYNALMQKLQRAGRDRLVPGSRQSPGSHSGLKGAENIDRVINVDQSPLGRTPRSNPATYTGIFTAIRDLYSKIPESRVRGYGPGRFSFNVRGGRCEACGGDGLVKVAMHFLPDIYVPCDLCKGKRYNKETLEIRYKDKNISDVLEMTVTQALEFFGSIPLLRNKLLTLENVGLGYIQLGQSATTLSGGEAQRVKLSRELSKKTSSKTIYMLDEPTTGLHFVDIRKLLDVLNSLVDAGNSVLVIEHNMEVIKFADYIIDLGPEGGDEGGRVVAAGTPEEVALNPNSYTGEALKKKFLQEKAAA